MDTVTVPDPQIVADPRDGRPTTAWDLAWEAANSLRVPPESRAYPVEGYLGLVSREWLYERDRALPGRPLKFTLKVASRIKDDYWSGRKTLRALAREHKTTTVTISRLVHAHTMWYC